MASNSLHALPQSNVARYNPNTSAINPGVMSYALRFYLYFFVAGVVVTVVAVRLRPYGLLVNLAVAFAEAYLTIIVGRRGTRKKESVANRRRPKS